MGVILPSNSQVYVALLTQAININFNPFDKIELRNLSHADNAFYILHRDLQMVNFLEGVNRC